MPDSLCPACGQPVPADAPAGLCPNCVLDDVLNSNPSRFDRSAYAVTSPGPGKPLPPPSDSIAGAFPQLVIEGTLGHGGMGAVYLARQPKLDRQVALKIIRPEAAADPAFAERFMREARMLARLDHPNIVRVYDFGETDNAPAGETDETETRDDVATRPDAATNAASDGEQQLLYYFVMEYVDGVNLRQLLQDGGLDPRLTLSIVQQICDALQYAHDEGIVHRDIKPENILIDSRGRVKIADFGLAKLAVASAENFTLTGTHQVMGTPRYMAPEQMEGSRTADQRADVYSLGVVFYEMLTGHIPAGHFEPPSQRAAVDGRLDDIVLRAMARDPDQRFQQVSQLRSEVVRLSGSTESPNLRTSHDEVPATGFSTIIDREAAAAWHLITGPRPEPADRRPARVPTLLLLMLGIGGLLTALLPWVEVEIIPPPPVEQESVSDHPAAAAGPQVIVFRGVDLWPGFASAVAFGVFISLLVLLPRTVHARLLPSSILMAASGVALVNMLLFEQMVDTRAAALVSYSGSSTYAISVQYGFFTCLGVSGAVLLLTVLAVRQAVLLKMQTKADQAGSGTNSRSGVSSTIGRSLASLRFQITRPADLAELLRFHFGGLGYQQISEGGGEWVFRRGKRHAALWATSIHPMQTTLVVRVAPFRDDKVWIRCDWYVVTWGALMTNSETRTLEREGEELRGMLEGDSVEAAKVAVTPPADRDMLVARLQPLPDSRMSRKAIFGAMLVPLGLLIIASFLTMTMSLRSGPSQVGSSAGSVAVVGLVMMFLAGLLLLVIPLLTTLLGVSALKDIRYSGGRIYGTGLAFFDAISFPVVVVSLCVFAMLGSLTHALLVGEGDTYFPENLAIIGMLIVVADIVVLRRLWRRVCVRQAEEWQREAALIPESQTPSPAVSPPFDPAKSRLRQELKSASMCLILVAVLGVVFWIVFSTLMIMDAPRGQGLDTDGGKLSLVGGGLLLLVVAGFTIWVARNLKAARRHEVCFAGAILSLLPWAGFAWIVSLPVGVWMFHMLQRNEVRDLFAAEEQGHNLGS